MNLRLIQPSCAAINSIYLIYDFLDDTSYYKFLQNKIEKYTEKDEMLRETNVKANVTLFEKLLVDKDFNSFHLKILDTLRFIFTLRTPHPNQIIQFDMINSWGMRHKKGDFSNQHIHNCFFSGSFYFKIPEPTQMLFQDYDELVSLQENMLILFPGHTKHSVGKHVGEVDRISMAFNINYSKVKRNYTAYGETD